MINRVQGIIGRQWPNRWPALAPHFEQPAQTAGNRQHTLNVLAAMEALLNRSKNAAISAAIINRLHTRFGKAKINPNLLRAATLLHDIGKNISPSNHEENSYQLFCQIVTNARTAGSDDAMIAVLIRHHADLGNLQTGETSPLFLCRLIKDIRYYKLNLEAILPALVFLTVADWAAYQMLSPATVEHFLASVDYLKQNQWWNAEEIQIKRRLWQDAINKTELRLNQLLTFSYLASAPANNNCVKAKEIVAQHGLDWTEFKHRFALVRFDGGYSVFARSLKLTGSPKRQLKFIIPHLIAWLPPHTQTDSFADKPFLRLHKVNLRTIKEEMVQSDLNQLKKILMSINVKLDSRTN